MAERLFREKGLALIKEAHNAGVAAVFCVREEEAGNNIVDACGSLNDLTMLLINAVAHVASKLPAEARDEFCELISKGAHLRAANK